MKSVAIVGAGPAGLVAAKTLLQHAGGTKYKVTVFESAESVGGMWRGLPGEKGDKCSPHMRTNLSRFTVSFPDLSWTSVDLSDPNTGLNHAGPPPMFPRAWEVGRYLETYAKRYIPAEVIKLNTRVTTADLAVSGSNGPWNVTSVHAISRQESNDLFDHLIVASGFFDRPAPGVSRLQSPNADNDARIQHSSTFREVSSLVDKPGKIVVIGGGISGSEAASTAAFQISSARYSPGKEKPQWKDSTIYHIFSRPFYCLPRYLPYDPYNPAIQDFNLSPHFLPLDLVLYNIARRGDGPISASNGLVPPDKAKKGHEFIRTAIGGDQRAAGRQELVSKPDNIQYPAFTGITDMYTEFVRAGLIIPVLGRAECIVHHSGQQTPGTLANTFSVDVVPQAPWASVEQNTKFTVDDVTGIIEATGFQVHLEYLPDHVKNALDYDPDCHRVPFLLSRGSVFAPNISNVAFVGFYEGPYWGFMEMQARLIARAWDTETGVHSNSGIFDISESRLVRQAINNRTPDVPQFWMADYVGLVEEFARNVGMQRADSAFSSQLSPLFPSRYQGSNTDEEATTVIREVQDILQQSDTKARFVAAASFRGMQGTWTLQRKIDSRHASMPGGTFKGTAHFHPRNPTASSYTAEYLYIEEGTLTMDNGMSFPATRRYIYRYNEDNDTVTAWFAEDDGLSVGNLFNTWAFYPSNDTYHGWLAKGSHWCSPDTYKSNCEFRFRGASLETFGITYDVSGPKKDYSHESWYSRPNSGNV